MIATLRWPFRPLEDFTEAVFEALYRLFPSDQYLPRHLQGRRHWDYPWPFHALPRAWTTYDWGEPEMLIGNQERKENGRPKPIGESGSFQLSRYPQLPLPLSWLPLYMAFTTRGGTHFRMGARWDDVDAYTQFPSIAIKRMNKTRVPRPPPPRGPDEPETETAENRRE